MPALDPTPVLVLGPLGFLYFLFLVLCSQEAVAKSIIALRTLSASQGLLRL